MRHKVKAVKIFKEKDKKIEQLGRVIILYKNIADNYCTHLLGCDIDKTDFCTCGLKEVKDKIREVLKEE